MLAVDGAPFFVYGAAFFYERLPRDSWAGAMAALRDRLHVNTLDLYVPWNWHELSDGVFDFDGHTNPRRDLREVLRLAHAYGFKLIVRPGPVIRNEWRNGGYPAWLLTRPEYGMPLRDVLEGRYPATATLQNARSDDAAARWVANRTHRYYARRWLERALAEFAPVASDVLAVALDDDQGAYIDNQTWPAPHLRTYLEWLRGIVRGATSPAMPVFINTYEMKVPASSPVWAMGNWYQSDAFAIGEHDRSQLEFSTSLLGTRPHQPTLMSEFQAGWLQQPQDVLPRASDPANTLLAMHALLATGARGIVNFPAQDTYAPAGWEAPFANAFYAWDAALPYDGSSVAAPVRPPGPVAAAIPTARRGAGRAIPTAYLGRLIETYGPALAGAQPTADAAVAYLTSAFDPARLSNADVAAIADATIAAQRACRAAALTCRLIDLRFAGERELARYPVLLLPAARVRDAGGFVPRVRAALAAYRRAGGIVERASRPDALLAGLARAKRRPVVVGAGDATYAEDPASGAGFLILTNFGNAPRAFPNATVHRLDGVAVHLPPLLVGSRDALLLPLEVPLQPYAGGFARNDRLVSSSCPVLALVAQADGRGLDVVRSPDGNVPCTTRFAFHGGEAPHIVTVRSAVARFTLTADERAVAPPAVPVASAAPSAPPHVIPVRNGLFVEAPAPEAPRAGRAIAYLQDVYRDGYPCVVLENDLVRVIVSPAAGGRAFVFEDKARARNAFDTIGALRDDVLAQPPASPTDRIAKYTHQFPAGFFNRPYAATIVASGKRAVVRFRYDAPDAYPNGAVFERTLTLEPRTRAFAVDANATFAGNDDVARAQREVIVSSLTAGDPRAPQTVRVLPSGVALAPAAPAPLSTPAADDPRSGVGLYDAASHDLVVEAWSDVPDGTAPGVVQGYAGHLTASVTARHLRFGFETAATLEAAQRRLRDFVCATLPVRERFAACRTRGVPAR